MVNGVRIGLHEHSSSHSVASPPCLASSLFLLAYRNR